MLIQPEPKPLAAGPFQFEVIGAAEPGIIGITGTD